MKRKRNQGELVENSESSDEGVVIQTYAGPNLHDAKKYLQFYSNYVFSSIIQSAREKWLTAIPTIVNCILKYNNIHLCKITMRFTLRLLPEPALAWISDDKQEAEIYLNEELFDGYCARRSIGYTSWSPPIDFSQILDSTQPKVNLAIIKCAVFCDHIAQHLIYSYYNEQILDADPHTFYTNEGSTFSSIFKISKIITASDKRTSTSTFGLLGNMDPVANFNFAF